MTTSSTRISGSGQKVLRVLKALRGHSVHGLSNGELAKALNENPATINRCCNTLIAEGLAMQLDTGRYAHSIAMLQIAQAHANEMSRTTDRIHELTQRVNAGAH